MWSTDITYIRLARGFVYLVAVIDWYSRRVLAWRISNSMDTSFCTDCLEDALGLYDKPEIVNTDQDRSSRARRSRACSSEMELPSAWTDAGGRWTTSLLSGWRSVKHEDVYLKDMPRWPS
ncbi:hypothetical protein YTPLAS72_12310 [Nitrospira sp.]|nr:hypothetical protein YTPLAS72_12310 [Nitrospira sp.]